MATAMDCEPSVTDMALENKEGEEGLIRSSELAGRTSDAGGDNGEGNHEVDDTNELNDRARKFFGSDPRTVLDEIASSSNDYLCDAMDALEFSLRRDFPGRDVSENVDSLLEAMQTSLDVNLDKFELYVIRNIFNVPTGVDPSDPSVRLPQASKQEKAEEQELDREIRALQARIDESRVQEAEMRLRASQLEREASRFETIKENVQKFTEETPDYDVQKLIGMVDHLKEASAFCEKQLESESDGKIQVDTEDKTMNLQQFRSSVVDKELAEAHCPNCKKKAGLRFLNLALEYVRQESVIWGQVESGCCLRYSTY